MRGSFLSLGSHQGKINSVEERRKGEKRKEKKRKEKKNKGKEKKKIKGRKERK